MAASMAGAAMSMNSAVNAEGDPNSKSWYKRQSIKTQIAFACVLTAIAMNAVAFFGASSGSSAVVGIVGLAAGVGISTSAVVSFFQLQIEDSDTLREVQNELRGEVNNFRDENSKLTTNVDDLEAQVDKLNATKDDLHKIAEQQGGDVEKFMALIKENGQIIAAQKATVIAMGSQEITKAILAADMDRSGSIGPQEMPMLQMRLMGVRGLKTNMDVLTEKVKENGTLSHILALVHELKDRKIPDDQKAFLFDKESLKKGVM